MDLQNLKFASCLARQARLKADFLALHDVSARYERLMAMGRSLPAADPELRNPLYLVSGCQSEVFLRAHSVNGKIYFSIYSEALISSGLAALLLAIYNEESIETILNCPPVCIDEMGILATLSPGRSNGLASIYKKMKQECVRLALNENLTM